MVGIPDTLECMTRDEPSLESEESLVNDAVDDEE